MGVYNTARRRGKVIPEINGVACLGIMLVHGVEVLSAHGKIVKDEFFIKLIHIQEMLRGKGGYCMTLGERVQIGENEGFS